MRLIDADELFKDERIEKEKSLLNVLYDVYMSEVLDEIDAAPTLDAVPVIRCRDCIYSVDEYGDNECYCRNRLNGTYLMYINDWDHYCSWAERKEE